MNPSSKKLLILTLSSAIVPAIVFVCAFTLGGIARFYAVITALIFIFVLLPILFVTAFFLTKKVFFKSEDLIVFILFSFFFTVAFLISGVLLNLYLQNKTEEDFLKSKENIIFTIDDYHKTHGEYPKDLDVSDLNNDKQIVVYFPENENKDFILYAKPIPSSSKSYYYCSSYSNEHCYEHEEKYVTYTRKGKWIVQEEKD